MTQIQQQKAAKEFAERWKGKGYEKGESQIFWTTLLTEVFGVEHVDSFLLYEQQVHLDHTSFVDEALQDADLYHRIVEHTGAHLHAQVL